MNSRGRKSYSLVCAHNLQMFTLLRRSHRGVSGSRVNRVGEMEFRILVFVIVISGKGALLLMEVSLI